jgi:type IV pilus assembly protein PilA
MTMRGLVRGFREGEKGFTLIELLVVIAILGIIAAIVVPNFGNFFGRGQTEACKIEARMVTTATMAYASDNQACPTSTDELTGYFDGTLQGEYTLGGDYPDCTVTPGDCPATP